MAYDPFQGDPAAVVVVGHQAGLLQVGHGQLVAQGAGQEGQGAGAGQAHGAIAPPEGDGDQGHDGRQGQGDRRDAEGRQPVMGDHQAGEPGYDEGHQGWHKGTCFRTGFPLASPGRIITHWRRAGKALRTEWLPMYQGNFFGFESEF
jgi:hypothetical protein